MKLGVTILSTIAEKILIKRMTDRQATKIMKSILHLIIGIVKNVILLEKKLINLIIEITNLIEMTVTERATKINVTEIMTEIDVRKDPQKRLCVNMRSVEITQNRVK